MNSDLDLFKPNYINRVNKQNIPPVVWSVINRVKQKCFNERQCHFTQLQNNNNDHNEGDDGSISSSSSDESKDGVWGLLRMRPL